MHFSHNMLLVCSLSVDLLENNTNRTLLTIFQVLPNPSFSSGAKVKFFEFAGKLIGKCLLDSCFEPEQVKYISARFARSFLAQIIGLAVTFKVSSLSCFISFMHFIHVFLLQHFESDDPELYKTKIRYILENDVSDFDLYFAEEEYSSSGKLTQVSYRKSDLLALINFGKLSKSPQYNCTKVVTQFLVVFQVVPLKPNGSKIRVTNDNKMEYLNRLAQYKLSIAIKEEIECFNKGKQKCESCC